MTDRARALWILGVTGLYAVLALRLPVDAGWRIACGPLAFALALAGSSSGARSHLRALMLGALPLVALGVRRAALASARCDCGPGADALAVGAALAGGAALAPLDALVLAAGVALACLLDLSAAGLHAGGVQPLSLGLAAPIAAAAAALAGASLSAWIRVPRWLMGVLACLVVATGFSWRAHLEVPALARVLATASAGDPPWRARLGSAAYRRLLARGDVASFLALLAHARDARLPKLYAAALERLGRDGEALLERELTSHELGARLQALRALAGRGPLTARPAFLRAVASHHVPWPASQRARTRPAAELVAALTGPDRLAWWPATIELVRTDPAPGAQPALAGSLDRLAGAHGAGPPGLADFRLLWDGAEGVRLAAAVALCLHPAGAGRAGEAPRLAQLLGEARVGDAGLGGLTPCGPTAPQRAVLLGELLARERIGDAALQPATRDACATLADLAREALDLREAGKPRPPGKPVAGGRILEWIDLRALATSSPSGS